MNTINNIAMYRKMPHLLLKRCSKVRFDYIQSSKSQLDCKIMVFHFGFLWTQMYILNDLINTVGGIQTQIFGSKLNLNPLLQSTPS